MRTLIICLGVLAPATALAVDSPRALGLGGAVRGDPVGNSSVTHNPAGMSRAQIYGAQTFYFRGGPADTNELGLNVVDSKTQPAVAVGLAYGYTFTDSDAVEDISGHDARLAFSSAVVPGSVSLGLGLRYLSVERSVAEDLDAFALGAGLLWSLSGSFHLGLVGESLINVKDDAYPRRAGGGVAYTGPVLTADVDVLMDFDAPDGTAPVFAAGAEVLIGEVVPFRVGYTRDNGRDTQYLSGGIGFVTARAAGSQLHLGYKQNLDDSEEFVFGVGITAFL